MAGTEKYINVVFPSPLRRQYTYKIPTHQDFPVLPGQRVVVPLRRRATVGYVSELVSKPPPDVKILEVSEIIDRDPIIPSAQFGFLQRLANYYLAPFGKVLAAAIPSEFHLIQNRRIYAVPSDNPPEIPEAYRSLYAKISEAQSILLKQLKRHFPADLLQAGLQRLKQLDLINEHPVYSKPGLKGKIAKTIELACEPASAGLELESLKKRAPRQWELLDHLIRHEGSLPPAEYHRFAAATVHALEAKGLIRIREKDITFDQLWENFNERKKDITLTDDQESIFQQISAAVQAQKYASFLIQGVTGSGKTEVYIKLIHEALKIGRTAMILVPEITLTTHLASRFRGEFQDLITIWHSHLSPTQRSKIWASVLRGEFKIVIGARSALFLPLASPGLIIVDEEQDSSFKQREQEPHYHARDAALLLAQCIDATVVLGSATPSLESFYNAVNGKLTRLPLARRFSTAPHPVIHVVNMRDEWQKEEHFNHPLSDLLRAKIAEKLERREQVLLLQNRRGFSNYLLCSACGHVPACPNCDITLTYHKKSRALICHYCNFAINPPTECPQCNGNAFLYPGYGTQRAEDILAEAFPTARIKRLDMDTAQKSGYLQSIMQEFENKQIDILLGTQMIAKGLDFPNISLVGVLNADIGLNMPDFRARERVFNLLYQVAGRTGRGDIQGEVVIQTFVPEDFTIRCALQQNLTKFSNFELNERNQVNYPPFSRLALVLITDLNRERVHETAQRVLNFLSQNKKRHIDILGPSSAPIGRIKNRYRYMLILKSRKEKDPNGAGLRHLLLQLLYSDLFESISKQARISIDIDPLDML